MPSNYMFILLMIILWPIAFLLPADRFRRRGKRLLWVLRMAFLWWVLGMGFYLLGFLLPNILMPKPLSTLLSYTLALPCRLGVEVERYRVSLLDLARFDLAWAMIWGLPFAVLGAMLIAAMQANIRRLAPLLRLPFRV